MHQTRTARTTSTGAASSYKEARRLDQAHRDLRGIGRSNRKRSGGSIGLDGQQYRAEEALEQAEENLRGIDDPREIAPLEYELGALQVGRGMHANAIPYLRRALVGFKSLEAREDTAHTYHSLIAAYQALNRTHEALECIREMGLAHASMLNVLVKDLHPLISAPGATSFASGNHECAVLNGFKAGFNPIRNWCLPGTSTASTGACSSGFNPIRNWCCSGTRVAAARSQATGFNPIQNWCWPGTLAFTVGVILSCLSPIRNWGWPGTSKQMVHTKCLFQSDSELGLAGY
ncbi:MAG: hypothetical protein QOE93_123, partial [Actinomycetota bacterium]|nr:hypothetical protein [Actinomycetota bacterium]